MSTQHGKKDEIEIQITMDIVTLAFIVPQFIFLLIRIFINKRYPWNKMVAVSMFYILCSILACLYELLYRFSYDADQCWISDFIQEIFICFTRSVLLIYYVALIDYVFNDQLQDTEYNIDDRYINSFYAFIIIVHMIILPSIYIPLKEAHPYLVGKWGVFCFTNLIKNITAKIGIILYQLVDALITCFLTGIFIQKLCKMYRKSNTNGSDPPQWLKKTIFISFVLTLISIISSWIIIGAGRLDGDNPHSIWRWMYPLDYIPNCLCVFLWIHLNIYKDTSRQRIPTDDSLQAEGSTKTPKPDQTQVTVTISQWDESNNSDSELPFSQKSSKLKVYHMEYEASKN